MSQPTIKDVAKLAGVSISTVSRVMNKSKPVSPEAERKVMDAINKLGFKPNELARSLVMKKSNSIGILVKDIGLEYMAQMIRGAEEIGRMYNYDILLTSTYGDFELEKKAVDFLYRKQVEGVIIMSEDIEAEIIVKIKEYGLPYILLDRFYKSNDYHTVSIDFCQAMAELTRSMLASGCQKPLYLRSDSGFDISKEKEDGFEEAVHEARLPIRRIDARGSSKEAAYHAFSDWLSQEGVGSFDLLMCENDEMAVGVLDYCYDQGIKVPEVFQLTGFGGTSLSVNYRPRLTTVVEPFYDIGAVAMRILTKTLQEGYVMTESVYLPTDILQGESSLQA